MLRKNCPQSWQFLASTPVADVRHCRECDRDVYLCLTPAEFVTHGELGRCVAIPENLPPETPGESLGLGARNRDRGHKRDPYSNNVAVHRLARFAGKCSW
jgi:hypothetical protein